MPPKHSPVQSTGSAVAPSVMAKVELVVPDLTIEPGRDQPADAQPRARREVLRAISLGL